MTTEWDDTLPAKAAQAWSKASDEEKSNALVEASQYIDKTFKFRGEVANRMQALSWPRVNAFRDDGTPIDGVPTEVQNATSLLASFLVAKFPMTATTLAHILVILEPVIVPERLH